MQKNDTENSIINLNQSQCLIEKKLAEKQLPWLEVKCPFNTVRKRSYHTACVYQQDIYFYGGYDPQYGIIGDLTKFTAFRQTDIFQEEDLLLLTKKSSNSKHQAQQPKCQYWIKIQTKNSPLPRYNHSAVIYSNKMYILGGRLSPINCSNQILAYDFQSQQWQNIVPCGQTVPKIDSHQAVIYQDKMIIFGGFSDGEYTARIFSYEFATKQWKNIFLDDKKPHGNFPEPRSQCSLGIINNFLYIFGGRNMDKKFNDLWLFDITNRKFQQINVNNKPEPRSGHSCVIYQENLVIFGGIKGITHERNDLLFFNTKEKKWIELWKDSQDSMIQAINNNSQRGSSLRKTSDVLLRRGAIRHNMLSSYVKDNQLKKKKKYRTQLKQHNYYNNNKPVFIEKDKKKKENIDKFLVRTFLEEEELGNLRTQRKISQQLQSITQSILMTFMLYPDNHRKQKQQVRINKVDYLILPSARDGHSASLINNRFMAVFGGSQHMIAYNSVIIIDLARTEKQPLIERPRSSCKNEFRLKTLKQSQLMS